MARNVPLIPTMIRTRFQDEEDLASQAGYDAAVVLGQRIGEQEEAIAMHERNFPEPRMADPAEPEEVPASPDVIEVSVGVDRVAGAAGADDLSEPSNAIQAAEHDVRRKARLLQTPFNSGPEASRAHTARLKEARDALMAAYVADGMSREEAALAVDTFIAREAPNTLGKMGMAAAEWLPGIGEAMSAAEAAKLSAEIDAARAAGDYERAEALQFDFVLAAIGAIPLIGKGAKLFKLADRLVDAIPPLRRQAYRRKLLEAQKRYGDTVEGFSIKDALGEEQWQAMDKDTRKSLLNIVNYRMGEAGEDMVKNWLDHTGLGSVGSKVAARRRYVIDLGGGKEAVRHFDEATAYHFESTFGGFWLKKVEGGRGWEVKTGNAQLSKKQEQFAEAAEDPTAILEPRPAQRNPVDLLKIENQMENLRVPLADVDEASFRHAVRQSMHRNGHAPELVQQADAAIGKFFEASRAAKKNGNQKLLDSLTADKVLLVLSATFKDEERQQS